MNEAMYWWGKILGFIFGYLIAGFWGALIGCWAGHQFDISFSKTIHYSTNGYAYQVQNIIFEATFSVMGYLAKADGRVSEHAINQARQVMQQMGLNQKQKRQAIAFFTQGKQPDYDLDAILIKLRRAARNQSFLLQHFLELQLKVIYNSDHYLSANKQQALNYIAQHLGFMLFNTNYNQYTYADEQSYQHGRRAAANQNDNLASAYAVLGITNTASNQEVKTAYRRLMSRYHPDKVIARGETSLLKAATEKTQQIKAAYEQIKEARSMV